MDSDSQTSMERLFAAGGRAQQVHRTVVCKQFFAGKPCVRKKGGAEDRKREKTDTAAKQAGENEKSGNVNKITMKLQADHLIMGIKKKIFQVKMSVQTQ